MQSWIHVIEWRANVRPELTALVDDRGAAYTYAQLKDTADRIRNQLLRMKDVGKVELIGEQDEKIFVEFSMEQLAGLGIDRSALIAALQAHGYPTERVR